MEGRLLCLERPFQYDKESKVVWQVTNNPSRLGVALSQHQIPQNPEYVVQIRMNHPRRPKHDHLLNRLSDLLAEDQFQARESEDAAWTEW